MRFRILWTCLAALLAVACEAGRQCGDDCDESSDCADGLVCGDDVCVPEDCQECWDNGRSCGYTKDDEVCEFSQCG
jgi:hypothetical protein